MRVLAVAIVPLIFLVTECYERPDPIIWNKVEDIPEDTVLAGIKHGNWSYELVSIEGDTSELIVDYEYFGSIDSIYKDSVQALIVDLYTPYDYDGPVLSTRDVDDAFFRDYVRNFARQFEEYDKENSGSDWGGMYGHWKVLWQSIIHSEVFVRLSKKYGHMKVVHMAMVIT